MGLALDGLEAAGGAQECGCQGAEIPCGRLAKCWVALTERGREAQGDWTEQVG